MYRRVSQERIHSSFTRISKVPATVSVSIQATPPTPDLAYIDIGRPSNCTFDTLSVHGSGLLQIMVHASRHHVAPQRLLPTSLWFSFEGAPSSMPSQVMQQGFPFCSTSPGGLSGSWLILASNFCLPRLIQVIQGGVAQAPQIHPHWR